jgi:hypothetical protein
MWDGSAVSPPCPLHSNPRLVPAVPQLVQHEPPADQPLHMPPDALLQLSCPAAAHYLSRPRRQADEWGTTSGQLVDNSVDSSVDKPVDNSLSFRFLTMAVESPLQNLKTELIFVH